MTRYHYVTVDANSFATLAKLPVPADSYIAEDQDSKVIREIMNKGYRFVAFVPNADLALFEKPIQSTASVETAIGKVETALREIDNP